MQNNTESSVNQAAEQEPATGTAGSGAPPVTSVGEKAAAAKPPASKPARKKKASKKKASKKKASKKKASKKKASKKKASKKKASKKKASKKKASKKKASKKKASKKKRSRKAAVQAAGTPWERLAEAAEEMRKAALELAEREAAEGRKALDDFVGATRAKLTDLESMAERGIARLTRK